MGSTLLRQSKEMANRVVSVVILVEIAIFLVPTNGKVEGHAAGYWDGVKLRLSSGHFWVVALVSGIGVALIMAAILAFSDYLAGFVTPPSGGNNPKREK